MINASTGHRYLGREQQVSPIEAVGGDPSERRQNHHERMLLAMATTPSKNAEPLDRRPAEAGDDLRLHRT
ncbi:MAG: hypothetical protein R3A46_16800 [Thermomicrobiales bacterium]